MSKRIKVTGYFCIEDDQYDSGPMGPLDEEAYLEWSTSLGLDDITFELDES